MSAELDKIEPDGSTRTEDRGFARNSIGDEVSFSESPVQQIRDIIVGREMKLIENQFAKLETRIHSSIEMLRSETQNAFSALESYLRGEISALGKRVEIEQSARVAADSDTAGQLKALEEKLQGILATLSQTSEGDRRDLRNDLLEQTQALRELVRASEQRVNTLVEKTKDELETNKLDSVRFGRMLSEIAERVNQE